MVEYLFRLWDGNKFIYFDLLNIPFNELVNIDSNYIHQFTGKKDKNKNNLYKGDILINPDDNSYWAIFWNTDECKYHMLSPDCDEGINMDFADNFLLEGNIIENPYLVLGLFNK
ncbi:MAG: YopX family protein [Clostridiales bacterium]|nr:YopX family protein [Clostridiales bacterium]MCF8023806.1 YopX family protein [Clostridiales bacterium]